MFELILDAIKEVFHMTNICRDCKKEVHWNDGLVMNEHGFICNDCLHRTAVPTHEYYGLTKDAYDYLVEQLDAQGLTVEEHFTGYEPADKYNWKQLPEEVTP